MRAHRSLFTKVLFRFFLAFVALGGLLIVFIALQFRLDHRYFLSGSAGERVANVGRMILRELNESSQGKWDAILESYAQIYDVDFLLFSNDARQLAGPPTALPEKVRQKLSRRGRHPPPPPPSDEESHQGRHGAGRGMKSERFGGRNHPTFTVRSTDPTRYWVGVRIPLTGQTQGQPMRTTLLAVSDSFTGNGLFFNPLPWVILAALFVGLSILIWLPLVRGITHPIQQVTSAAQQIAKGQFDVKLDEDRNDEIGLLGASINQMASRLDGFLLGQKRFLGDVAHELASPIARIQLGLGILEQRLSGNDQQRVENVIHDVSHMSDLVNELLSFSRAQINPAKIDLQAVQVVAVVNRVADREGCQDCDLRVDVDDGLWVVADPELLARALANLIRNAMRYAKESGPIEIRAWAHNEVVAIEVRDSGPGVEPEVLDRLFEPFFRSDPSRDRKTGGVGLGLAIVKTCIRTCGGTVVANNIQPQGFAVTIELNTSTSKA